jgi:hypothetical protein
MSNWIDEYLQANPERAVNKIIARGTHATHFELSRNVHRAVITGAPQYFRGPRGWQAFDLSLQADAAGRWGAPGAPARISPDGTLHFANGYLQRTLSAGWLDGDVYSPQAFFGGAGRAQGRRLLSEAGIFWHALVLTEFGVKEELHIAELPRQAGGEFFVYETLSDGPTGGLEFPPGSAIDAAGRRFALKRFVQGDVTFTGLPLAELERAAFPLVLDPSVALAGLSPDATIVGQAGDYADARAESTYVDSTYSELFIGQAYDSGIPRYYAYRAFLKFSLASLSSYAHILAATLDLACLGDYSTLSDFDVQVIKHNWAAQDPLSDANRQAAYSGCLNGPQDVIWRSTSGGLATGVRLASPPLATAWLTPGGAAYYSLRASRDVGSEPPPANGSEYLTIGSATHATAAYRPVLTLDYFAVMPGAGRLQTPLLHVGLYDTRIKLRARRRKTLLATSKGRG